MVEGFSTPHVQIDKAVYLYAQGLSECLTKYDETIGQRIASKLSQIFPSRFSTTQKKCEVVIGRRDKRNSQLKERLGLSDLGKPEIILDYLRNHSPENISLPDFISILFDLSSRGFTKEVLDLAVSDRHFDHQEKNNRTWWAQIFCDAIYSGNEQYARAAILKLPPDVKSEYLERFEAELKIYRRAMERIVPSPILRKKDLAEEAVSPSQKPYNAEKYNEVVHFLRDEENMRNSSHFINYYHGLIRDGYERELIDAVVETQPPPTLQDTTGRNRFANHLQLIENPVWCALVACARNGSSAKRVFSLIFDVAPPSSGESKEGKTWERKLSTFDANSFRVLSEIIGSVMKESNGVDMVAQVLDRSRERNDIRQLLGEEVGNNGSKYPHYGGFLLKFIRSGYADLIQEVIGKKSGETWKRVLEEITVANTIVGFQDQQMADENVCNIVDQGLKKKKGELTQLFVKRIGYIFDQLGAKEEKTAIFVSLETLLANLSLPQSQFLAMIIEHYGLFHPVVRRVLKGTQRFAQGKKTGSEILIGLGDYIGIISNVIGRRQAVIWQSLSEERPEDAINSDIVAVSPVLKAFPYARETGKMKIYTRYCGLSASTLLDVLPKNILSTAQMYKKIINQMAKNQEVLSRRSIEHGHIGHNQTVEFIRRKYIEQKKREGYTVNTMPYHPNEFSFDPTDYLKSPNEWELVVRVIDWDQAE